MGPYGIYDEGKFAPSVEAQLRTLADVSLSGGTLKIYFFSKTRKLLATQERPDPAHRPGRHPELAWTPDGFQKNTPCPVFFRIPPALAGKEWTALVVFGKGRDMVARATPTTDPRDFEFAERKIVLGEAAPESVEPGKSAVVQTVAVTQSRLQPRITMFFRMPPGVSDPRKLRGLLCVVAVANSADDVNRQLAEMDPESGLQDLAKLAATYQLGILTWGAVSLWNRNVDYDALTPVEKQAESREFDLVAKGWANALDELNRKFGVPNRNLLITGASKGGQWAQRLVIRMPERFRAASIRLAGTMEPPTAAASKVLWLLYDGELDKGCAVNLDFYDAARGLGYPILIKTEPDVPHKCTPLANALQAAFFEWVVNLKTPTPWGVNLAPGQPWPTEVRNPPFFGDVSRQVVAKAAEADGIAPEDRVPLPTAEIARAWGGK